jgi:hypothetical protein
MVDVFIYETGDGGDINILRDDIQKSFCSYNQIYLALWGGNIRQNTTENLATVIKREDWWGNWLMNESNQFNSNTERAIDNIVLNSAGIIDIENAVEKDLEFLQDYYDVNIFVSIEDYNRLRISVILEQPEGETQEFVFECKKNSISSFIGIAGNLIELDALLYGNNDEDYILYESNEEILTFK